MNPSEKLQNMVIDSAFNAEHESDVELWFGHPNKTQKPIYLQHTLKIYRQNSSIFWLRPIFKPRR